MLRFLGRGSAFERENNCAYFTAGDDLVLLDCPMSAFAKVKTKDLKSYRDIYVLVTHTHGDHSGGISTLIDFAHFVVDKKVIVVAPSPLVEKNLRSLLTEIEGCNDDWYTLVTVDQLTTGWMGEAIATDHTDELAGRCFGYRLSINGTNVIYTGDTNTFSPFEKFMTPGTYLYTEIAAYHSDVHLYCEDMKEKVKTLVDQGVTVYLMHLDREDIIRKTMEGTGARIAPLEEDIT